MRLPPDDKYTSGDVLRWEASFINCVIYASIVHPMSAPENYCSRVVVKHGDTRASIQVFHRVDTLLDRRYESDLDSLIEETIETFNSFVADKLKGPFTNESLFVFTNHVNFYHQRGTQR